MIDMINEYKIHLPKKWYDVCNQKMYVNVVLINNPYQILSYYDDNSGHKASFCASR